MDGPFQVLMKDHHLKSLLKFKKHGFLHIILSQNVIGKDREGSEGTKSVRKNQKKENQHEFKKHHWIMRDGKVKLSGLKCEGLDLPKGVSASEMCHIHCCLELGVQKIVVSSIFLPGNSAIGF